MTFRVETLRGEVLAEDLRPSEARQRARELATALRCSVRIVLAEDGPWGVIDPTT